MYVSVCMYGCVRVRVCVCTCACMCVYVDECVPGKVILLKGLSTKGTEIV